jgi:hypothetical protein
VVRTTDGDGRVCPESIDPTGKSREWGHYISPDEQAENEGVPVEGDILSDVVIV